jgi:hypothetical protein
VRWRAAAPCSRPSRAAAVRRHPVVLGGGDGAGQHAARQLVAALRHADLQLPRGAAVELGGAAGARAAATGGAAELDLEQTLVLELVQVELGDVTWHPEAGGGLVAADRAGLRRHPAVEGAAHRLGEGGDAEHAGVEVLAAHPRRSRGSWPMR